LRRKLPDELRGRKGKKDYQNDDFYQIRILMYLSHHKEARIGDFTKEGEYGITSNKTTVGRLLVEMIDAGWIKKTISEDAKNVKKYSLIEKGHEMKDFIRELQQNHPLFDFKLFTGIKSLG